MLYFFDYLNNNYSIGISGCCTDKGISFCAIPTLTCAYKFSSFHYTREPQNPLPLIGKRSNRILYTII